MNRFPVDFTPEKVLNDKKQKRLKRLREKIEEEKSELRARILEEVTKDDKDKKWWIVPLDRNWEETTIIEIRLELEQNKWVLGYYPRKRCVVICTHYPSDEEQNTFFDS